MNDAEVRSRVLRLARKRAAAVRRVKRWREAHPDLHRLRQAVYDQRYRTMRRLRLLEAVLGVRSAVGGVTRSIVAVRHGEDGRWDTTKRANEFA